MAAENLDDLQQVMDQSIEVVRRRIDAMGTREPTIRLRGARMEPKCFLPRSGQPATVVQTYGAYVFGPTAGSQLAMAAPSTPLSSFVSAQALANNNMQGWTVGQFQQVMAGRLGSTSGETVQVSA